MVYIPLNIMPILAAAVLGLSIDAAHHLLVGWGVKTPSIGLIILAALAQFWLASILAGALILAPDKADPWIMAVGSAVVIWAGFVLPVLMKSWGLVPPPG
ncbi:MAG: hypothetical protein K2X59_04975 [Sphingomonas sp.]|nr:hypothetical protein [Sphingomonas sp.]